MSTTISYATPLTTGLIDAVHMMRDMNFVINMKGFAAQCGAAYSDDCAAVARVSVASVINADNPEVVEALAGDPRLVIDVNGDETIGMRKVIWSEGFRHLRFISLCEGFYLAL